MRGFIRISKNNFALSFGLMMAATGNSGCQLFKKKNTSSVKSAPAPTRLAEVEWTNAKSASTSAKIADTNTIVIPISVNDIGISKGLGTLSLSISSDDSSFFSTALGAYSVNMKLVKNGVDLIAAKPIVNGTSAISTESQFEVNHGDKFEVIIENISHAFVGFDVYMYSSVQAGEQKKFWDDLKGPVINWRTTDRALSVDAKKNYSENVTLPVDGLWNFSVNSRYKILNAWTLSGAKNADDCSEGGPLDGTLKMDFSRVTSASPRATVKEIQDVKLGDLSAQSAGKQSCNINASFSLEAAAESLSLAGETTNLQKKEMFVSTDISISLPNLANGRLPLADFTLIPTPPNQMKKSMSLWGKIENTSLKIKTSGSKREGLSVYAQIAFTYPLNSAAANIGPDEWKNVQLVARGMALADSAAPKDAVLRVASGSREGILFEETHFIDLAEGEKEYIVELIFPDAMKGAYASVSLGAKKLFEYIEPMQPRPGSPASVTKEANRNQTLLAFQKQVAGYAASPATFKPISSWYGPAGEPPDYKSDDKSRALQMDAARVLAGMEAVRNTFHLVTEEGIRKGDLHRVSPNNIEDCLANAAPHWSDITIHYYCAHGTLRGCYTNGIRATAGFVQAAAHAATDAAGQLDPGKFACAAPAMDVGGGKTVPVVPSLIRAYVWQKCAMPATESLPTTTPPANFIPGAPGGAGCPSGLPHVPAYSDNNREAFSWLTVAPERAHLFRYMMDAPTFGLNNEDQQAVINAFWRVRNPADKDECKAKRPRRAIDPIDGTHCLADKVYTQAMAPTKEGR